MFPSTSFWKKTQANSDYGSPVHNSWKPTRQYLKKLCSVISRPMINSMEHPLPWNLLYL